MSDHKDSNLPNELAIHPADDESAINPTPDDDDDELQVLRRFEQIPPDTTQRAAGVVRGGVGVLRDAGSKPGNADGSSKIGRFKKMYKSLPPVHQKNFRSKIKWEYQTACDSSGEGNGDFLERTIESDDGECVEYLRRFTAESCPTDSDSDSDRLEWFKVKSLDVRGVSGSGSGDSTSGGGGGNADGTGGTT